MKGEFNLLVHDIIKNGRPEDTAIVDEDKTFTYADFAQKIKKFRNRLYNLGVRQGRNFFTQQRGICFCVFWDNFAWRNLRTDKFSVEQP